MNCKNCGYLLSNEDQFCKNCGSPVVGEQSPEVPTFNVVEPENVTPSVVPNNFGQAEVNNFNQQPMMQQQVEPMPMQQPAMTGQPMPFQQQAMPMQQPMMQQPYANNSMNQFNNQAPKNDNSKFIIIGIIVAVVVAIIGVVVVLVVTKNNGNNINPSGNNGSNIPATPTDNKNSTEVTVGDFTFSIPNNLQYEEVYQDGDEELLVGDLAGTWVAKIFVAEGNYDVIKSKKSELQSVFVDLGYVATPAQVNTYGGYEVITVEVTAAGTKELVVYSKANNQHYFGVDLFTADNSIDYTLLNTIAPILKNAKYKSNTRKMEMKTNITFGEVINKLK